MSLYKLTHSCWLQTQLRHILPRHKTPLLKVACLCNIPRYLVPVLSKAFYTRSPHGRVLVTCQQPYEKNRVACNQQNWLRQSHCRDQFWTVPYDLMMHCDGVTLVAPCKWPEARTIICFLCAGNRDDSSGLLLASAFLYVFSLRKHETRLSGIYKLSTSMIIRGQGCSSVEWGGEGESLCMTKGIRETPDGSLILTIVLCPFIQEQ
jgi:hypothetical protein